MVTMKQGGTGKNDPTGRTAILSKFLKLRQNKLKTQMKQAVIQAAQTAGAGNMSADVARLIKSMTESQDGLETVA